MDVTTQAEWRSFEIARWREAVREHGLRLHALDPADRAAVLEAMSADLRCCAATGAVFERRRVRR